MAIMSVSNAPQNYSTQNERKRDPLDELTKILSIGSSVYGMASMVPSSNPVDKIQMPQSNPLAGAMGRRADVLTSYGMDQSPSYLLDARQVTKGRAPWL